MATPDPPGGRTAARYDEPSGNDAHVDLQLSVQRALERPTPRQRAVVVLRYYEDLTEVEATRSSASVWGR